MNNTRSFSTMLRTLAAVVLASAAVGCGSNGGGSHSCGTLASGDSLDQGQSLPACHANYHLDMQNDGNLVLYAGSSTPSNALWATNTAADEGPVPGNKVTMQSDGDFVLFDSSGNPIMHTNTGGHPGAYLDMQDDGNLVIYVGSANPSNAIWATGTNQ
jgi:hypothetical protein